MPSFLVLKENPAVFEKLDTRILAIKIEHGALQKSGSRLVRRTACSIERDWRQESVGVRFLTWRRNEGGYLFQAQKAGVAGFEKTEPARREETFRSNDRAIVRR